MRSLNNLGHMLFTARKEAGFTLSDVARGTNIRLPILQMLENSELDDLPAPGYTKGFINSYARFIGRDPQPFLEQYEKEIGLVPTGIIAEFVQAEEAVRPKIREHTISLKMALIIAAAVALLFFIGFAIFSSLNKPAQIDENPLPPSIEASTTLEANTTESPYIPYTLEISVQKDAATNVVVRIDGANVYDGVLTGDNRLEYSVTEKAEVTAASPDKIRVLKDGEREKFPEGENQRIEIEASKR